MDFYEKLAEAIIVQACDDYRIELLWLKMHRPIIPEDLEDKEYKKHKANASEIEVFFRSGWYQELTKVEGEYLIERIRKEINYFDE